MHEYTGTNVSLSAGYMPATGGESCQYTAATTSSADAIALIGCTSVCIRMRLPPVVVLFRFSAHMRSPSADKRPAKRPPRACSCVCAFVHTCTQKAVSSANLSAMDPAPPTAAAAAAAANYDAVILRPPQSSGSALEVSLQRAPPCPERVVSLLCKWLATDLYSGASLRTAVSYDRLAL